MWHANSSLCRICWHINEMCDKSMTNNDQCAIIDHEHNSRRWDNISHKKKEYTMWSDNDHNARSPVMPFPAWQILKFRFIFLARSLRNVNICFSISHHLRSDRNKSTENVCASKNMIHKNVKTKFRMLAWRLVDFRRKFIHKSTACTGWNLAEAIIIELINFISFGARRIRCYS